jgi:hypothetical protein
MFFLISAVFNRLFLILLDKFTNTVFSFKHLLIKANQVQIQTNSTFMQFSQQFDERMLLFLDSIKRSNNVFLCNLLYWVHMREWYVRLLAKYNLYGVECRRTIRSSVHNMFNEYCDMI